MVMRNLVATIMLMWTMTALAFASWTSPHPLEWEENAPAALIPFPQKVTWEKGSLSIPSEKGWKLKGAAAKKDSVKIAWRGLLKDCSGKGKAPLVVTLSKVELPAEAKEEGYTLTVSEKGVQIGAEAEAGFFYALQTLRQLAVNKKKLSFCKISDWPAFRYRGYLHDCGRNFRKVERLKKELDMAAQLKVNLFQWHMTDYPAWHVQCRVQPKLNDPQYRTRDKNDTYSYKEIREVIEYARERNILVIPELDMPGHSAYFTRAFGFAMHTPEGMKIVGQLWDEFLKEIPKELCPIIHFGGDEVRIPNAKEFVDFVVKKLEADGRTAMQWSSRRDLAKHENAIGQRWLDGADVAELSLTSLKGRTFDSIIGYTNVYEPALMVRRYFFMRPCAAAKGDAERLGTIMGIWPDGRVDDKELIPELCNMWPSMCAMVERSWKGGAGDGDKLPADMPAPDTEAGKAYRLFLARTAAIRKTIFAQEPFPVWPETSVEWTLVEPMESARAESVRANVLKGNLENLKTRKAYCGSLYFRTREGSGCIGMFRHGKPGQTLWAVTKFKAAKAGNRKFMIGFDAPERSNRRYMGLPKNPGDWTPTGARIWLNGKEIKNPHTYKYAGQRRSGNAWQFDGPPLDPEELWWMLDPVELPLRKGENTIVIEHPFIDYNQAWQLSFIPLEQPRKSRGKKKR